MSLELYAKYVDVVIKKDCVTLRFERFRDAIFVVSSCSCLHALF